MNSGILFFTLLASFAFAESLFAYIDPGTGSYATQILIAAIASSLYFIKTSWSRIRAFVGKKFFRSEDK